MILYIVVLSMLVLTMLTLWLMIKHHQHHTMIALLAPLLIFSWGFTWEAAESIRGFPTSQQISQNQTFLWGAEAKPMIYLLVMEGEKPRLYEIPWSRSNAMKMHRAQEDTENGQRVAVDMRQGYLKIVEFDLKGMGPKNN